MLLDVRLVAYSIEASETQNPTESTLTLTVWSQVGGMGDVVTALGRAVQEEDHDVMVVLPKYDVLNYDEARFCSSVAHSA